MHRNRMLHGWIYDMQLNYFIVKETGKGCFTILLIPPKKKKNRTKVNNEINARNTCINYLHKQVLWGFGSLCILQFIQTFIPLAVFINSTPHSKVYMTPFFKTLADCDTLSVLLLLGFFTVGDQPPIEEVHLSSFISHPWELIGGFGKFVLPRWERSLHQQDSALWHPANQLDSKHLLFFCWK